MGGGGGGGGSGIAGGQEVRDCRPYEQLGNQYCGFLLQRIS